jgi:hypothetical protein
VNGRDEEAVTALSEAAAIEEDLSVVGPADGAARWYGLLSRNWHGADADLPELAEVRSGARRTAASR